MKATREIHIRPDPAMEQRLLWIDCVLAHGLGLAPAMRRPSVVLRRAVEAYVAHLESILRREGDPATADLRAAFEPSSVQRCSRGEDLRLTEAQLTALPCRPLSDIKADVIAAQPKVIDVLKLDLEQARRRDQRERYGIGKLVTNGDTK
jgi:hypothetical protein